MTKRIPKAVMVGWALFWPVLFLTQFKLDSTGLLVTLGAALLVVALPDLGSRVFRRLETRLAIVAHNKRLAVVVAGMLPLVFRLAALPVIPIPEPMFHDEFAYLLAADTFNEGRLANPTHPMWRHFETMHVLQQPTYTSKYPIAQSVFLALGQWLGHPWIGAWLSVGIMCAVVCWMLQQWLPPGWALLGAALLAARIGITSYWMNSYWGGAIAAAAGALLYGALPGLRRGQKSSALLTGIALAVLALSRPFEGVLVSLPVAVLLVVDLSRRPRGGRRRWLFRCATPIAGVLLVAGSLMAYYHWRVTGSPFRMPYQVYQATYEAAPVFVPLAPRPGLEYNHEVLRAYFVDWALEFHQSSQSLDGFLLLRLGDLLTNWEFFIGPELTLALLSLPFVFSDRRMRIPLIGLAIFLVGMQAVLTIYPHYLAPALGLLMLVIIQSMRHLRLWRDGRKPTGRSLVRWLTCVCFVMLFWCFGEGSLVSQRGFLVQSMPRCILSQRANPRMRRPLVERRLEAMPGRHLVLVRYQTHHNVHDEWVFNRASIDDAKVVWAREMDPTKDRELIRYFGDRRVWLLNPDDDGAKLEPHPLAEQSAP